VDGIIIAREVVGGLAIIFGIIAKWKLGSRKKEGWFWAFISSLCWFGFSILIQSPMSIMNNIIYFFLAYRGYKIWTEAGKNEHL